MINMKGQKCGRLKVVSFYGLTKGREARWLCQCDCGKKVIVRGPSLRRGVLSCGCLRIDLLIKRNTKHSLSHHKLFWVLDGMKARCYNSKSKRYKNYGGRGIRICNEWKNNFKSFYDWAIKSGWEEGLTIDRKNNNGNYCPTNCHFITVAKNNLNMSTSKFWVIFGEKFESLSLASKKFKVSGSTIMRWCDGYITASGRVSLKRKGCYSIKKYNLEKII